MLTNVPNIVILLILQMNAAQEHSVVHFSDLSTASLRTSSVCLLRSKEHVDAVLVMCHRL